MGSSFLLVLLSYYTILGIDNGLGITPPMGWRSWNCYDCISDDRIITDARMRAQMKALVDKSRMINGKYTSLAEIGFNWTSMDDGWQQCNCSTRQDIDPHLPNCSIADCRSGKCSWHSKEGVPMVRKDRFPDMKGMVSYGHSLGLKVGTYLNNCICMEKGHNPARYEQDAKWLLDMGFDGVKIDNCGNSHNVSRYAEIFNKSGKPIRIENCHNFYGPDLKTGFCPMNFYRSGGDIHAGFSDIIGKIYGSVDFNDRPKPGSFPGCWAYPDMTEIGNFPEGDRQVDEERSHWGLWSIVSSPMILGFDMSNKDKMDRVWPIITNLDARAVNHAWVGHPGTLIKTYPSQGQGFQATHDVCDGSGATIGWRINNGTLQTPNLGGAGKCLMTDGLGNCPPPTLHDKNVQCGNLVGNCSRSHGKWSYNSSSKLVYWQDGNPKDAPRCLKATLLNFDTTKGYFTRQSASVRLQGCPNKPDNTTMFTFTAKGELQSGYGLCLKLAPTNGMQLWSKPLSDSKVAILVVNTVEIAQALNFPLADIPQLPCHGKCKVRNVWTQTDSVLSGDHMPITLNSHASAFYILEPL